MKKHSTLLTLSVLTIFLVTSVSSPLFGTVETALAVRMLRSALVAGGSGEIEIELVNIGAADVVDVKAHLQIPTALTGIAILRGSYQVFDRISASSSVSMEAELMISAALPQGVISLLLNLVYNEEGGIPITDNLPVGIVVNAAVPRISFTASIENYTMASGTEKELHITIENTGDQPAYDVEIMLSSTSLTMLVLKGGVQTFSSITPSGTVELNATVAASGSTPIGPLPLSLALKYHDEDGATLSATIPLGLFVDTLQSSSYSFDAAVDDYHVVAGSEQQLAVLVKNIGESDVYNLEAGFVSTSPQVAILRNATTQLGAVMAGCSFLLMPIIGLAPALPSGPVTLGLGLKFQGVNGVPSVTNLSLGLFVNSTMPSPRPAVHVRQYIVSPQEFSPGGLFSFIAEVENSGATVTNLQAVLAVPPTTPFALSGPALRYLGVLQNGQRSNASFSLTAVGDAAARYYPVQLSITYFDNSDRPGTVSETVSIPVHSLQSFQLINIAPSVPSGTLGSEATFDADLLLIGTESARFVQAGVLESNEFKLTSFSTAHIGFVDPDSPVPFSLGFRVNSAASEGEHILNVRISYWDSYNVERHQDIQITVTVSQSQGGQEAQRSLTVFDWLKILFGIRP